MAQALPPEIRREVLQLLAQGVDSVTIGKRLNVKPSTIRQIKLRSIKARKQKRTAQLETHVRWLLGQMEDVRRTIGLLEIRFLQR